MRRTTTRRAAFLLDNGLPMTVGLAGIVAVPVRAVIDMVRM